MGSGKNLREALNGIDRIGDFAILTPPNFRPQTESERGFRVSRLRKSSKDVFDK
jgi:hypothetical protein